MNRGGHTRTRFRSDFWLLRVDVYGGRSSFVSVPIGRRRRVLGSDPIKISLIDVFGPCFALAFTEFYRVFPLRVSLFSSSLSLPITEFTGFFF